MRFPKKWRFLAVNRLGLADFKSYDVGSSSFKTELWNGMSDNGEISAALAPKDHLDPCSK